MSDSVFNVDHVPAGTTHENKVDFDENAADKAEDTQAVKDTQAVATDTDEEDDLDDLDDMEFMLDEIENRIAPLA